MIAKKIQNTHHKNNPASTNNSQRSVYAAKTQNKRS